MKCKTAMPSDISNASADVQQHWLKMIKAGQTERFATMAALQLPPGLKGTDRAVMQRRYDGQWLDKMPKHQAHRIVTDAKKAGINISGKFYMSGLADTRAHCDPAAWIDSAADIRKVAKIRNLNVSGIVDYEAVKMPPPASKRLSEKLINEMSAVEKHTHPKMKAGEMREMVIDKYAPRYHKKQKA